MSGGTSNRLREAREYVGFTIGQVAAFLKCERVIIEGWEVGEAKPSDFEIGRLSRLYRRPVAWLRGDPVPPVEIPADVFDLMERKCVTAADRAAILDFVQFCQHDDKVQP